MSQYVYVPWQHQAMHTKLCQFHATVIVLHYIKLLNMKCFIIMLLHKYEQATIKLQMVIDFRGFFFFFFFKSIIMDKLMSL